MFVVVVFFEIVFILSVEVAIALDLKPVSSLDFYNVSLFYMAKEVKKEHNYCPRRDFAQRRNPEEAP